MLTAHDATATPSRISRFTLLAAAAAIFAASVAAMVPAALPMLLWHAIVDGGLLILWMLASWGLGTDMLRLAGVDRRLTDAPLREIVAIAIGLGVVSLTVLCCGVFRWLDGLAAWVTIGSGLLSAAIQLHTRRVPLLAWWRDPPSRASWLALLAVAPLGIAAASALILPGLLWGADDPAGYDVVAYHLQMPREWFELGRITTLPHNVFSFFPLNVEMQYLLAMELRGGAFAGMYLAQLMHTAFIGLSIAAVWAIARPLGALPAAIGAIVTAAVPWMPLLGAVAYNEGGLMLYATLALGLALRGRWATAGVCAGLAAGCKPTGAVAACVLVPLVVAVVSLPLWRTEGKSILRGVGLFVLAAVLTLSPWLIRTALASHGNPVFPLAMNTLGHGGFDDGQVERFIAAHSPRPDQQSIGERFRAFWTQVGGDWHFGTIASVVPIWLLLIVPALWIGRRNPLAQACALLLIGNTLVWLFATHLQGRFLTHAIPLVGLLVASGIAGAMRPSCSRELARASDETREQARGYTGSAMAGSCAACLVLISVASFAVTFPFKTFTTVAPVLGLESPGDLQRAQLPPEVASAIYETDRPLVLVGDAKAFWYAVPQARLHYRSVFDVPSDGTWRNWLGPDVPADALVIIDAGELERFSRTYRRLPPVPEAWRGRELFVVEATTLLDPAR